MPDDAAKKKQMMQNFLNRKRKMDLKVEGEEIQKPSTSSEMIKEDETERKNEEKFNKAKKALLFDAKRAKDRAKEMGPQGYLKPKIPSTNKEFLRRTIQSTMPRGRKKEVVDDK
ncbi:hypothetical protein B9Z55_015191 [Caenorhabditis nigoni]|uniref:Uncharacterized protein n=1 Tax=Caenorhabditis nigoni TaxID=1611254 RepID=A0A2G5U922_9PELO|nr:hypothetical protein B9Z55_015191 [Caenorhabditis nigoni]